MKYQGTITGEFTKKLQVEADSSEAATEKFAMNEGEVIEETATGKLEVENVEEVGE